MNFRKNNKKHALRWEWEIRQHSAEAVRQLQDSMGLNPLLARVLISRGMKEHADVESFLNAQLANLSDPSHLVDMDKAVERLLRALNNREKICVYGDYDVDGTTATVLLVRFFKRFGHDAVDYCIPNRISDGYGLKRSAIDRIAGSGAKLLITVDNGIASLDEVAYANSLGLDVIVTDHHQPGPQLPAAVAVVNPNRMDAGQTPNPLAGVGVAFKLLHALRRHLDVDIAEVNRFLISMLDLVALGTVADIVPLVGDNRIFVKHGIQQIQNTDKVGLQSLLENATGRDVVVSPNSISYYLAPRLNAAGRHDKAYLCVELLLTDDRDQARSLTRTINDLNDERRSIENDILESCLAYIEKNLVVEDQNVILVEGEGWHIGVVGIVASRLLERFYKPAIVLVVERDLARGSGRSIDGFDLYKALSACQEHLIEYGGHKMAAGLTLQAKNIPLLREAINQYAEGAMDEVVQTPRIYVDAEVFAEELTLENVSALSQIEPYGTSNPQPVFFIRGVSLLEPYRVVGNNHLKLQLCKDGLSFNGIGFSLASCYPELEDSSRTFDVAFTPVINDWRGNRNVEMEIKDIHFN